MKNLLIFPLFGFVVVATAIAVSNPASAASTYDNTLIPRTNIHMDLSSPSSYCTDSKENLDLTMKWPEIFQFGSMTHTFVGDDYDEWSFRWNNGHTSTTYDNYINSWNTKTYWGVMQDDAPGSTAYIWWTDDPNATGVFNGSALPGYSGLDVTTPTSGKKVWAVGITMDTGYNCDISVIGGITGDDGQDSFYAGYNYGDGSAARKPLFIYLYDITYPEDYEGEEIPDSTPTESEENTNAPKWYISTILDFKAKIHDTNFNTFDGNPFLCEDDLAPVLNYEIWRDVDPQVLITSGTQSATAEINYDFGRADENRDYEIVGWYECFGDEFEFTDQGRLIFTVNTSGTLAVDLFEACVDENFPFIHPDSCLDNMYTVVNLLAFGEVTFPSWTFNPACQNLNTLDEWLGLPNNYQVCPQIPNAVRSVVTPFVAFMLGLITMKFIHRRSGDFNG